MNRTGVTTCSAKECRARIIWRRTPTGKVMPLDATPVAADAAARGTYVLVGFDQCEPYVLDRHPPDSARHMNHWSTCKRSNDFRKGTR